MDGLAAELEQIKEEAGNVERMYQLLVDDKVRCC